MVPVILKVVLLLGKTAICYKTKESGLENGTSKTSFLVAIMAIVAMQIKAVKSFGRYYVTV